MRFTLIILKKIVLPENKLQKLEMLKNKIQIVSKYITSGTQNQRYKSIYQKENNIECLRDQLSE